MLRLRLNRKSRRVGRQKRKRCVFVLSILGEIEVHAADEVPSRMTALEEILDGELGCSELGIEGGIDPMPQVRQQRRSSGIPRRPSAELRKPSAPAHCSLAPVQPACGRPSPIPGSAHSAVT